MPGLNRSKICSIGEIVDLTANRDLICWLIDYLFEERGEVPQIRPESASSDEIWSVFRALVNTRVPVHAEPMFYERQDRLLSNVISYRGITSVEDILKDHSSDIAIWKGDITGLEVDAIVNAANNQLLGCWIPQHHCIDNAIHTFSGVQLREACNELMAKQGHPEPEGRAKITSAYNLPSKYVVHTVGPAPMGKPDGKDAAVLASCYNACLDQASIYGCSSVAFCCISTGVFGYPKSEAASIAIGTVDQWLRTHKKDDMRVVFNVFSDEDEQIYRSCLHE